ncbi:MAG: hypothetical protein IJX25_03045 [Clostridia bacterium]|nr:hypothetical protein [Clostridia bacterium]
MADKKEFARKIFENKPIDFVNSSNRAIEQDNNLSIKIAGCYYGLFFDNFCLRGVKYPKGFSAKVVKEYGEWMVNLLMQREGEKSAQKFKQAFNAYWDAIKQEEIFKIKQMAQAEIENLDKLYDEQYFIEDNDEKIIE